MAAALAPQSKYAFKFSGRTPEQASNSTESNGPLSSLKYSGPKSLAGKTFTMVAPNDQAS
jgi:hypothetical protein